VASSGVDSYFGNDKLVFLFTHASRLRSNEGHPQSLIVSDD
jgi:hypothetical protein